MGLRFYAYCLFGVLLLGLGLVANNWRLTAAKLPKVEKERDTALATVAQVKSDFQLLALASAGYQREVQSLQRASAARPNSPVRLCRAHGEAGVPVPSVSVESNGASTPAGVVSGGAGENPVGGPDVGPKLRALADRADEVSARARALQKAAEDLSHQ